MGAWVVEAANEWRDWLVMLEEELDKGVTTNELVMFA